MLPNRTEPYRAATRGSGQLPNPDNSQPKPAMQPHSPTRPAVFLDRDGVLNRAIIRAGKPYPPQSLAEFKIVEGAQEACTRLRDAGFLLIVFTNQPDVARGQQTKETIEQFHAALRRQLPIDDILTCFHDDVDHCQCRKPKPGLILDARARWPIDLDASYVIGDRWRDIGAGCAAGCKTVFLDYDYDEPKPAADVVAQSLSGATDWILTHSHHNMEARLEDPLACS